MKPKNLVKKLAIMLVPFAHTIAPLNLAYITIHAKKKKNFHAGVIYFTSFCTHCYVNHYTLFVAKYSKI